MTYANFSRQSISQRVVLHDFAPSFWLAGENGHPSAMILAFFIRPAGGALIAEHMSTYSGIAMNNDAYFQGQYT